MIRYLKERIDFTGEEKGKLDWTINMLKGFKSEMESELVSPTESKLYNDTDHLIVCIESYIRQYYN